jgi:hypothetical protein
MIKNRHPLPLINKTLNRLVRVKIFIKFNLKDIYYYIYIYNNYKWKIVFKTYYRHFEYFIMPFGLVNILVIFQIYINMTLADLLDYFIIVYLNNILIYSRNENEYYNYIY